MRCESGLRQWKDNGDVVIGLQTPDVGIMQISPKHHLERTKALGLDIYNDIEDNVKFGRMLYDEAKARGVDPLSPWYCAHPQHLALLQT